MEQGWIPVEERLPEEHDSIFAKRKGTVKWQAAMFEKISDRVLVTAISNLTEKRIVTCAHTTDGKWRFDSTMEVYYRVIAWRPMPEPYREGEPKQTNADRIRSMTDEELATYLPMVSDFICQPTKECIKNTITHRGECEKTEKCAMKWLRAESEGI